MKLYMFIAYVFMSTGALYAQNDTMYIMHKNNSVVKHGINNIDSITFFSSPGITDKLFIVNTGNAVAKYKTSEIDSIIFYRPSGPNFSDTTVTDADGNIYKVIKIGTQYWLAENLKTTKYNDGTPILQETDNFKWIQLTSGAYCWYNNDSIEYAETFGALYNWYSINTGKLCPAGWRVPNDLDWTILVDSLGGDSEAGGKLKATGSIENGDGLWHYNSLSTNESGFTALPGGTRYSNGRYANMDYNGNWWSYYDTYPDTIWTRGMDFTNIVQRLSGPKYIGLSVRCVKGRQIILPEISTLTANNTTQNTSSVSGTILNDGGSEIVETGFYISQISNPSSTGKKIEAISVADTFAVLIDSLVPGETYHYQAYGINSLGEALGEEHTFTTIKDTSAYNHAFGTVSDIDGNIYKTIQIGNQLWMAENLKTGKFYDGSAIPLITEGDVWQVLQSPAYCWYGNDESANDSLFGKLYNWYAVNTNKLCPVGWHVPSVTDWEALIDTLGGNVLAGAQLKAIGTIEEGNGLWLCENDDATNKSGFTALPAGLRISVYGASFNAKNYTGFWWSSTESNDEETFTFNLAYNRSEIQKDLMRKKGGISVRCIKSPDGFVVLPTISTLEAADVTQTTSIVGGILINNDESVITEKGICWGTTANPSITGSKVKIAGISESFTVKLDSLVAGETYHVQAYAVNSAGETFGEGISFTTERDTSLETGFNYGTVTDIEGNVYETIKIGDQVWMAENLKTSKFSDGSIIQEVSDSRDWYKLVEYPVPAYCWYNNEPVNHSGIYGALYNWFAVETGKLCPSGWHVPSDSEWMELEVLLGMDFSEIEGTGNRGTNEGGKLKDTGYRQWNTPNTGAVNEYGFSALPGGSRDYHGRFWAVDYEGSWWTSTKYEYKRAWERKMSYNNGQIERSYSIFQSGNSVRCVKD